MIETYYIRDKDDQEDIFGVKRINPKHIDKRLVKKYISSNLSLIEISHILTTILIFKIVTTDEHVDGFFVIDDSYDITNFNSIVETEYFNYDGVILGHKKTPSYFFWKTTALRIIQDLPMDTPLVDYLEKNHVFLTKRSLSQPKTDPWDDIFS